MTQEVTRRPTEYLPASISKEQAAYLLHTIWPKAPDVEVIKAAILCQQYGLNPLMRQVYLIEFGKEWVVVLGIKATRQIAQQALKSRGIRYSYADGPRVMTEKEQIAIRGKVEPDKIWAITRLKDSEGNIYPGYGFWPANKAPYGTDKGNDAFNMAFIRSERNALDKLAPGALPDIEVADDSYVVADYRVALEKGKQEFSSEVAKDVANLWPAEEKPTTETKPEPELDELRDTQKPVAEEVGSKTPEDRLLTKEEFSRLYKLLADYQMDVKAVIKWIVDHKMKAPPTLEKMPKSTYDKIMAGFKES